jgi:heme/copper-type cytochrome/quinol oxidase subunit 2
MQNKSVIERIRWRLIGIGLVPVVLFIVGCSDAGSGSKGTSHEGSNNRTNVVPQVCEPYEIEITGSKDRWHVRYPGVDGRLASGSKVRTIRNIHVPLRTTIVFVLKSTDYVYVLSLPQYRLKEIAVPELEFRMEFRAEDPGRFALVGDPLCGDPNVEMQGQLIVEARDQFVDWLSAGGPERSD